jgi:low affinity Fe/Cu permease
MSHGKRRAGLGHLLERISHRATIFSGSSWAFVVAAMVIVVWLICGPFFDYSNTWQLVVNTGTTIITFLMVFLIQRSQNKESRAVQLKLNELVAATKGASNSLIGAEDLTEEELDALHAHYQELADMAKHESDLRKSHSVEEARARHQRKIRSRG